MMDGLASHAHQDMLQTEREPNVSQLLAQEEAKSLEMNNHAMLVSTAQLVGNQMPCRENVLESHQPVPVPRSMIQMIHTDVSNVQITRLV